MDYEPSELLRMEQMRELNRHTEAIAGIVPPKVEVSLRIIADVHIPANHALRVRAEQTLVEFLEPEDG